MAMPRDQHVPDRTVAFSARRSGREQCLEFFIFSDAVETKLSVSNEQSVVSPHDLLSFRVHLDDASVGIGNDDAGCKYGKRKPRHTGL